MARHLTAFGTALALALGIAAPFVSHAADPAQGAPIQGADVMDGKNKPGQDGWSWTPVPRDQAASKEGKTLGNDKSPENTVNGSRPVPDTGKHLSAGDDPGTPVPTTPEGSKATRPAQTVGTK